MRPIVLQILACALIAAGALRPGERLATAAGAAVVESVTVQPGERRVYNVHVEGDQRYLVGDVGVLAHNMGLCDVPPHTVPGIGNVRTCNGFVKQLHRLGYVYNRPANDGRGWIYRNASTGEEVRIHPKPSYADPLNPEKFVGRFYYRYRTGPDQGWGSAVHLD
jgi:hypothetical protein